MPLEHANAENTGVGASTLAETIPYYDSWANGTTILSQTITTTKYCCIIVTITIISDYSGKVTDIQRGGVNKTVETTVSAGHFALYKRFGHLQYATEVLDAGTYTYDLVNTRGGNTLIFGSTMKIVAISDAILTGDANPSDVLLSKTFYKDDATDKLTGTLLMPTRGGGFVHVHSELEEPLTEALAITLIQKRRIQKQLQKSKNK